MLRFFVVLLISASLMLLLEGDLMGLVLIPLAIVLYIVLIILSESKLFSSHYSGLPPYYEEEEKIGKKK